MFKFALEPIRTVNRVPQTALSTEEREQLLSVVPLDSPIGFKGVLPDGSDQYRTAIAQVYGAGWEVKSTKGRTRIERIK